MTDWTMPYMSSPTRTIRDSTAHVLPKSILMSFDEGGREGVGLSISRSLFPAK